MTIQQPITTVVLTEQVPDALRGRVFGTYAALAMVAAPVGLGLLSLVIGAADALSQSVQLRPPGLL